MTFDNKSFVSTPPTNRGVVNTNNSSNLLYLSGFAPCSNQNIIFDWIQCTIFDIFNFKEVDYFYLIFGITADKVIFENGALFNYEFTYSYKNIKLFSSSDKSLGFHFYITGQGCRIIEELNLDYFNVFRRLLHYNCKFTRVDISIDDFTNKYFTVKKIQKYINDSLVKSKFKSTIQFIKKGVGNNILDGNTVWFGSRSSQIMICIYNKLEERLNNNCLINSSIKYWTRCELRFRDIKAQEVINNITILNQDLNSYIKGILLNYIQFLVPSLTDSNKSRWETATWWTAYCNNVERIQLSSLPYDTSISKKQSWLDSTVSKSEFSVLVSNIPNLTSDYISSEFVYNLFISGSNKIKDKDLQYINEYRLSRGYNPLSLDDINTFIESIKDVLLLKNK